ncbi:hypothetical protein GIB67_033295 [Kingdonia uniflora]|uniref:DUF4283 domain-containing protein n=1 Tax=Kingdonia uniflora TaxID=39325 RepID=A0A7J7LJU5_9MAGN|nr:hypothetical protein GIB67_033295 [Kingdonia uniflora]
MYDCLKHCVADIVCGSTCGLVSRNKNLHAQCNCMCPSTSTSTSHSSRISTYAEMIGAPSKVRSNTKLTSVPPSIEDGQPLVKINSSDYAEEHVGGELYWTEPEFVYGSVVRGTILLISYLCALEDRQRLLDMVHQYIASRLFFIRTWRPFIEFEPMEMKSIPIWVMLHDLPDQFWNGEGISRAVEYNWIPVKCSHCKVFGHNLSLCAAQPINKESITGTMKWIPKPNQDDGNVQVGVDKSKAANEKVGGRLVRPFHIIDFLQCTQSTDLVDCRYEVTMTFVADYDHMERYFQIGMDDLFYFQLPFKVCIHFLNIRAPAVSVETFDSEFAITVSVIESGISAQMNIIMYEVTMTFVANYDHMERYFQIGMDELFYSQLPFKVCLLFLNISAPAVFVETLKPEISAPLHMLMATVYCNLLVDVPPDWGNFGDVQGPFLVDESLKDLIKEDAAGRTYYKIVLELQQILVCTENFIWWLFIHPFIAFNTPLYPILSIFWECENLEFLWIVESEVVASSNLIIDELLKHMHDYSISEFSEYPITVSVHPLLSFHTSICIPFLGLKETEFMLGESEVDAFVRSVESEVDASYIYMVVVTASDNKPLSVFSDHALWLRKTENWKFNSYCTNQTRSPLMRAMGEFKMLLKSCFEMEVLGGVILMTYKWWIKLAHALGLSDVNNNPFVSVWSKNDSFISEKSNCCWLFFMLLWFFISLPCVD